MDAVLDYISSKAPVSPGWKKLSYARKIGLGRKMGVLYPIIVPVRPVLSKLQGIRTFVRET